MQEGFSRRIWPAFAAICLTAAAHSAALRPALAADASPWDNDIRSAARLIAGSGKGLDKSESGARVLRAGVELKLQPGWKTYWRQPGDSGVPPAFDFAASDNVRNVTVLWPAPARFGDGAGGHSIGYPGSVILPLRIVPQQGDKPVTLRMKLDYAVCEKVCVPAKAKAELRLSAGVGASAQDAALRTAEARVPKPAAVGDAHALAIRAVRREPGGDAGKPRVIVDVAAPAGAAVDLFAEGPSADWMLPLPEPVAGAPAGLRRFHFALDGLPSGARPQGATLRLTAVAGDAAVEATYRLD
jgi:DsbC/DsbD-like thiol-disulfide interchange protein